MSCENSFCSEPGSKRRFDSERKKDGEPKKSIPRTSEEGSLLQNFLSHFIFLGLLGSGAYGLVNLMKYQNNGQFCAVKIVKKTNKIADDKIRNEIKLGMTLDSQYVCKVFEYHEDDGHFFIVMEYLNGQDLHVFLRNNRKYFKENPKRFWFVIESILQGLVYLHSKGIAHFDIKPNNIILLLDNEENIIGVKLIDLGLSLEIDDTKKYFRGTSAYMAPEFFNPLWFRGIPSDIWSLGITAYAMLMASLPISSMKSDPEIVKQEIYKKISYLLSRYAFNPFSKSSECTEISKMQEFIKSCLIVNPENRPTSDYQLKNIPYKTSELSP